MRFDVNRESVIVNRFLSEESQGVDFKCTVAESSELVAPAL